MRLLCVAFCGRAAGRRRPTRSAAQTAVRRWQSSRGFFARSSVRTATIDTIKGIYVPAYLYTAVTHTDYQVEIGEDYQVTETYSDTDSNGTTKTRTRAVTKTEWRDLCGRHSSYAMDVLVSASRGISNVELERVEPFHWKGLRRYSPALLSGWTAEDPTLNADECMKQARSEVVAQASSALRQFMPGDSYRSLSQHTSFERETIDLVHVPLWILVVHHEPPIRLVVNGQTGKVWGKAPVSWTKIAIAVVAALVVIGAIAFEVALKQGFVR